MAGVSKFLDPSLLQETTLALLEHAKWSRSKLLEHQNGALRRMLSTAVKLSPWYKRSVGDLVRRKRPLSEFPTLTKQDLMANFDDIVLDKDVKLADVEQHLSGDNPGDLFLDKYYVFPTGGTSGLRAIILYDELAWRNQVANLLRFLRQAGMRPNGRVVGIGANSPLHISGRAYAELRHSQPDAPDLNVSMPITEIVSALNAYQPEAIITYPSFIRTLAAEQRADRLRIAPKIIGAVAESLSDDIRALTRAAWSIEVLNRYNATEIGCAASECALPNGIHLPEDLVIFESVDDDNHPVPNGTVGRKVLITTLANSLLPLIRYELSDLLAITDQSCTCGQPFARICSISGRREELLILPGADGSTREVPAIYLAAPLVKVPFVKQFQIVLRSTEIEARLMVSAAGVSEEVRSRAEQEILTVLRNRGVAIDLRVNIVDEIPRQGTGSKIKLVVRE
jgi:phenylacetate-CoA ligase